MTAVSLVGTAGYLPETIVDNAFFGGDNRATSGMFKGSKYRRHVAKGETASSMIANATANLRARLGSDELRQVDLLLTNVSCLDQPFTGVGASSAHLMGMKFKRIIDMQNTGCVSFVFMLELARDLMRAGVVKSALLCCVQNAAGRVFAHDDNRDRPQSAVPGDGCGVGYVVANDSAPVRGIVSHAYGDYADDMTLKSDDGEAWYAPRKRQLHIDFTEDKIAKIVARGNKLVPAVVMESCKAAEIKTSDVDLLVTNQPNAVFLRNWREALQISKEKQVETFEDYGNLFGAAIPINLAKAADEGRLTKGSRVALGGFSHAGDYAAAAIWQPG